MDWLMALLQTYLWKHNSFSKCVLLKLLSPFLLIFLQIWLHSYFFPLTKRSDMPLLFLSFCVCTLARHPEFCLGRENAGGCHPPWEIFAFPYPPLISVNSAFLPAPSAQRSILWELCYVTSSVDMLHLKLCWQLRGEGGENQWKTHNRLNFFFSKQSLSISIKHLHLQNQKRPWISACSHLQGHISSRENGEYKYLKWEEKPILPSWVCWNITQSTIFCTTNLCLSCEIIALCFSNCGSDPVGQF